eukprot:EG_transcript_43795
MAECLCVTLREVLQAGTVLSPHLCRLLLEGSVPAADGHTHGVAWEHIPSRPFYAELCKVLLRWGRDGRFPIVMECIEHLPELPEVAELEDRLAGCSPQAQALVEEIRDGALQHSVHSFLQALGVE